MTRELDVLPFLTVHYTVNSSYGNAELNGQISFKNTPSGVQAFNRHDLRAGKLRRRLGLASRGPALFNRIGAIVRCGAKKQMRGITAERIIAGMADEQFSWVYALMEIVGQSMGAELLVTARRADAYLTVSASVDATPPLPAGGAISNINLAPKSLDLLLGKSGNRCCHVIDPPGGILGRLRARVKGVAGND